MLCLVVENLQGSVVKLLFGADRKYFLFTWFVH